MPLGVFLSGGVDSTIISSLANTQQENIKCITLGFPENKLDESLLASQTAKRLNLNHSVQGIQIEEFLDRDAFKV